MFASVASQVASEKTPAQLVARREVVHIDPLWFNELSQPMIKRDSLIAN